MKFPSIVALLSIATFLIASPCFSQNAEKLEEQGRAAVNDPRFKNALRSMKNNPGEAVQSLADEHSDTVRKAEDELLRQMNKIRNDESPAVKTSVSKVEKLAETAMPSITNMLPTPAPSDSEVPATRSGLTATPVAVPMAQPTEEATAETPETVVQQETVQLAKNATATTQQIPSSPGLDPGAVPAPKPLEKKYDTDTGGTLRPKKSKKTQMEILAKESIMDNRAGTLVFRGNVVVDHPQYDMKCEKLEITMAEGSMMGNDASTGGTSNFKKAVATGGTVEIRSVGPKGETRLAMARHAVYDALNGVITLTGGPPYLQDGDSFIETNSPDAQIIMRLNGKCEIVGSERSHIRIPIEKGKKGDSLGGFDGLNGISERLQ